MQERNTQNYRGNDNNRPHRGNNKPQHQKPKMPGNPDPMSNPRMMGREGMKLLRDMAHGKFDFYAKGAIFRNQEFVKATITEVDKRLMEAAIHVAAVTYAYPNPSDPNVITVLHRDQKTYEAYDLIRGVLYSILNTGDTTFLYALLSKLPNYRYNI